MIMYRIEMYLVINNFLVYFHSCSYGNMLISGFPFCTVRHYEVVYLIHEDRVDEIESVKTKVEGSIRVYLLFFFK